MRRIKSGVFALCLNCYALRPLMMCLASAYIAASRRSDRSLEARVESARRASEIHKLRTGRSLRVTEQDVINEEMYEEEDDDLPMQYRRLTAHLQTGSVDFNRRLAAYLTNQVAMRAAMDQMINNSYAQQYPNAPQFAHNNGQSSFSPPQQPAIMAQSPASMQRSAPYPSPHQAGFRNTHSRSYSVATPNKLDNNGNAQSGTTSTYVNPLERRMSTPGARASPSLSGALKTEVSPDPDQRQTQSARPGMSNPYPPLWWDMGPLTSSLPPESQQMLGPALDLQDPFNAMLMAGSENHTSSPYYPWGNVANPTKMGMNQSPAGGMFSTLAPSVLDNSESFAGVGAKLGQPSDNQSNSFPTGVKVEFDPVSSSSKGTSGFDPRLSRENSSNSQGSGHESVGEAFWDSFVQEGGWGEEATAN
jgi:hypothetical protein